MLNDHVGIPVKGAVLEGHIQVPDGAPGIVLFAHGSGSSRFSPRNQHVAAALLRRGIGTLLFDLLTRAEEAIDERTRHLRFDVAMLAERLGRVTVWTETHVAPPGMAIGYFGASTGAAAALIAAAALPDKIAAVVSRGGRPDLAGLALAHVRAPTLLIVGGDDDVVIALNEEARAAMRAAPTRLAIVPGATHLFEEPGALEQVTALAGDWFASHFPARRAAEETPSLAKESPLRPSSGLSRDDAHP